MIGWVENSYKQLLLIFCTRAFEFILIHYVIAIINSTTFRRRYRWYIYY